MVSNCLLEMGDFKPHSQVALLAQQSIRSQLLDRWLNIVGPAAKLAMILDPRFKSLATETEFARLRELYVCEREKGALGPNGSGADGCGEGPGALGGQDFFHPSLRRPVREQHDECGLYRNEPDLPVFIADPSKDGKRIPNDPLVWWRTPIRLATYPILSLLARRYLGIPATSVPSESLFSTAGRVAHERRSSMKDSALNACILINRNWRFIMSADPEEYQPKQDLASEVNNCIFSTVV